VPGRKLLFLDAEAALSVCPERQEAPPAAQIIALGLGGYARTAVFFTGIGKASTARTCMITFYKQVQLEGLTYLGFSL
jgi:hypothetical protein